MSKLKRPRILKRRGSKVVPVATPTHHAKDWGEKCVDGFQVRTISLCRNGYQLILEKYYVTFVVQDLKNLWVGLDRDILHYLTMSF